MWPQNNFGLRSSFIAAGCRLIVETLKNNKNRDIKRDLYQWEDIECSAIATQQKVHVLD